jgi:hypothetical protein
VGGDDFLEVLLIFYPFGAELVVGMPSAGFTGGYSDLVLSGHFFFPEENECE